MSLTSIHQKILDLRNGQRVSDGDIIALSGEMLRMSVRIAELELGMAVNGALSGAGGSNKCVGDGMPPEGYALSCGARVAPVTIVNAGSVRHPGAAITLIVDKNS